MAAVKQMDLVDMGDIDHGERLFHDDLGAGLFQSLPGGCFGGSLAVFHEAGRQGPETVTRLDGAPT